MRFTSRSSAGVGRPQISSLMAQMVKHLPAMRETWVRSLGWENLLEKEMATHSSTLAWRIPRTEEPGSLQSMGSRRVGHDWETSFSLSLLPAVALPISPSINKYLRRIPSGFLSLPSCFHDFWKGICFNFYLYFSICIIYFFLPSLSFKIFFFFTICF